MSLLSLLLSILAFLDPVSIKVNFIGGAFAPAAAQMVVHVPLHVDNRGLDAALVGDDYERSSFTQLDGQTDNVSFVYNFRNLPPGRYVGAAVLARLQGGRCCRDIIAKTQVLTVLE